MRETIPESVRIGPTDYEIEPINALEGDKFSLYAYYHYPTLHIRYHEGLPRQRLAEVLLHETLHGIWKEYEVANVEKDGLSPRDREESYVTILSRGILQLVRDNPDFVAWLSQSFADEEVLERTSPLWAETR